MKKWQAYLLEKYNRKVIENRYGFISYSIYDDDSCYIETLFVLEKYRNKGKGKELEALLIEKENPWVIYCDVDKHSNGWENVILILTKEGYEIQDSTANKIILFKEIK